MLFALINVLCQMKINYTIIVIACFEPSHALHLAVQNGVKKLLKDVMLANFSLFYRLALEKQNTKYDY